MQLIEAAGGPAIPIEFDVADPDGVNCAVNEIQEHLGAVDVLVNNAGVSGPIGYSWDVDPDLLVAAHLRDSRARNLSVLARRPAGDESGTAVVESSTLPATPESLLSNSLGLLGCEGCCYQAHWRTSLSSSTHITFTPLLSIRVWSMAA